MTACGNHLKSKAIAKITGHTNVLLTAYLHKYFCTNYLDNLISSIKCLVWNLIVYSQLYYTDASEFLALKQREKTRLQNYMSALMKNNE